MPGGKDSIVHWHDRTGTQADFVTIPIDRASYLSDLTTGEEVE